MGLGSVSVPLSLPEDVLAALERGEPDRLLGTPETAQICFRGHPYALETGIGVWELARAVADLANVSGGVIVVGVRTAAAEDGLPEVAAGLGPLPAGMLGEDLHYGVIREHVRPAVAVEVTYLPAPHRAREGYLGIHVKPLREAGRRAAVRLPGARYWPLAAGIRSPA